MWVKDDYPFYFHDLLIAVIWNDTTTWTSVKRGYHFLILRNLINGVEKKSGSGFIQCCGFKDFSIPSIVQKYMGDSPVAGKKQNKMHRMKQRERGRKSKRKRRKERKKEGGKASKKNEPRGLMFHCSLMHPHATTAFTSLQLCWTQSTPNFQTSVLKILQILQLVYRAT